MCGAGGRCDCASGRDPAARRPCCTRPGCCVSTIANSRNTRSTSTCCSGTCCSGTNRPSPCGSGSCDSSSGRSSSRRQSTRSAEVCCQSTYCAGARSGGAKIRNSRCKRNVRGRRSFPRATLQNRRAGGAQETRTGRHPLKLACESICISDDSQRCDFRDRRLASYDRQL